MVGRVVCEVEGAPLNEASLLLEGCREASGGARVRLDVSHLPNPLRVFPGQCVAVKGLNPTGRTFVAQRLVTHLPAQAQDGAADAQAARSSGVSMVVAAGPFTPTDSMAFEPLAELLAQCSGKRSRLLFAEPLSPLAFGIAC